MVKKKHFREGQAIKGAKVLQFLGFGESGEVWSALTDDGNVIALKVFSKADVNRNIAGHEFDAANRFTHENILKPLDILFIDSYPALLLPYCKGGSVDGVAGCFREKMIWKLIEALSDALSEIHRQGYGHFDVKPSNILWDGKRFLLSDFGACCALNEKYPEETASDSSSFRFDAPEFKTRRCGASDIWSFGATVFYLYMGCYVFNGLGGRGQHCDSPIPYMRKSLPKLSKLVQECLEFDPEKRPTAEEINSIARAELEKMNACSPQRSLKQGRKNSNQAGNMEFWPDIMEESIIFSE